MAFILSKSECNKSWLLSFESRKAGDDIEENNCINFEEAAALRFSIYAAILLITAISAGYIAVSFP